MPKLQGFSWHKGYGSNTNPQKKHKSRCLYHTKSDMCTANQSYVICNGPTKCSFYAELTKKKYDVIVNRTDMKELYSYGKQKPKKIPKPKTIKKYKQGSKYKHHYYGVITLIKETKTHYYFETTKKDTIRFQKEVFEGLLNIKTIQKIS